MSIYCHRARVLLLAVSGLGLVGGFGAVAHGDTSATWNGSSNNWSSAADWSSNPNYPNNGVPIGALYDVVVGAGTINLDVSPTIQLLALSGGTIGGPNSLTVSGLFTWSGGQIGNSSSVQTLNANGGISLTGSAGSMYLKGEATINNSGVANWTGGFINALGNDIAGQNSTFNNLLGANFNVQTDNTYYGYGSNQTAPDVFNNAGTFTKSLTTGTTTMDAEFNSSGQVNVQTGTLALAGGGSESGSFSVSSGAMLNMSGTFTFTASSSVSGAGTAGFTGGTSTFNAGSTYSVSSSDFTGATVNFNSSNVTVSGPLSVTGGAVNFNTGHTITPTSIALSGGTIDGSDTVTTGGLFTWSGGQIGNSSSVQTLNANGGISLTGSAGSMYLKGEATINNSGVANWTGGFINALGNDIAGQNSTFNNLLGANFNVQTDNTYYGYGSNQTAPDVFNNAGTFTKSLTTGTTTMDAEFNSSGQVNVQTGTLALAGGGSESGSFSVSSGAMLNMSGTFTFTASSSVSGAGTAGFSSGTSTFNAGSTYSVSSSDFTGATVNFNSSNVTVSGPLSVTGGAVNFNTGHTITPTSIALSGGTIDGSDTVTTGGLFTWSGGQIGNSSSVQTLNANGGISLTGSAGSMYLKGEATINNSGVANWTGGFINALGNDIAGQNSTFNNLLGANFNVQTDNTYYGYGSNQTAPDVFNNAGTFTKSLTTGTTTMDAEFNSSGQVNVQTGTLALAGGGSESGSFSVSSGAMLNMSGTFTFTASSSVSGAGTAGFSSGTSTFNAGSTYSVSSSDFTGATVNFNSSNVTVSGPLSVTGGAVNFNTGHTITPTSIALSGGTIDGSDTVTTGGLFTWSGGQIGNSSSVQTLNANGGISLTGSAGSMYLKGEATINNSGVANWTGGFINALGNDIAGQNSTFNNLLGANFNVQTDNTYYGYGSNQTAPDVFSNAGTFTKSLTTGTTNMDAEFNSSGQVNVQTGTLALAGGGSESGSFSVSSGAMLNMSGTFTFTASSSVSGAGTAGFTGGTSTFNAGATLNPAKGITITGGTVQLDSVQTLASLTISGGSLNLTNTHLFINYGTNPDPVVTIRGYLASGYQGGNWGGSGIDSSAAAHNAAYALGYADSADPGNPAQLASGTIEIKYTLYGDTNLDGSVNSIDFGNLATNFGKSGKVWDQGDFNYDGTVNSIDFGLLAGNFGKSAGSNADVVSAADWAALDAFAAANGLMADVPEPTFLGLSMLAGIGVLARRRCKQRS